MSPLRQIARGLRALTKRSDADRDLDDEVQHYLEQAAAAHIARGLPPDAARRAAMLELGNTTVVREEVRAYGWENVVATLLADLKFALRRLRGAPAFTVVAVLTLALGVGASTAIFSVVNRILFQALPYPNADRVMSVADVSEDGSRVDIAFGTYRELVQRARSFEAAAVMRSWQPVATGAAEPERLDGQRVSASYFRVLGIAPALGRDFDVGDDRVNGPQVVVLSDGVWRRRFNADRNVIGRSVMLGGAAYTVIGVMPAGFENLTATTAEVWSLLQYDASLPTQGREWGHHLRMIARLREGVGVEQARRELANIARQPLAEFARVPWARMAHGLLLSRLQDDVTTAVKPTLLAALGAVALLLMIACVNVTNLLLARGVQRRGEFAMRAALGAGRSRLVRQLLTETVLLAFIGGTLGMLVAQLGVRAVVALSPAQLPRAGAAGIDLAVLAFAIGVTTLIGIAIGLIPALQASRGNLQSGLQQGTRRSAGGHRVARASLVVAEVALALVLLVGAGLLLRSLRLVLSIPPGFTTSLMLTMQVRVVGSRYATGADANRYFADALDAVRRVPGVTTAAFTSQLPLGGDDDVYGVHFESSPTGAETQQGAFRYAVSASYVEAMGIPLLRGRLLDRRDVAGAPASVLISESLARAKFPGMSPIGQRVRIGPNDGELNTIVGVVGDVKQASLALNRPDAIYITDVQQKAIADPARWIVVRTSGEPTALTAAVKAAIWSVDKDQAIVRISSMDALLAASVAERRFALTVFEAFAIAALVLAAAGIYGVLSGSVVERTREIGVRAALGASSREIVALILRHGFGLTTLGIAIGLVGAAAATRMLTTMLFGISHLDVATYVGVVLVLATVSMIACLVPAWRAASVDPAITLRTE